MISSFFRHLEEQRVSWLLVSGQATILYGAATFSEDVDLWVDPSQENLQRLVFALRASGACYYKLTPALTSELASRHHGFHFAIADTRQATVMYLDVMGCPPRVGSFEEARKRACTFDTEWGALRTVAIPDLVELKKTQRPRDYPIIGRLVLAFMRQKKTGFSERELRWAVDNVFGLSEFRQLVEEFPEILGALESTPLLERAGRQLARGTGLCVALEDEIENLFDGRIAPLRQADRHFWRAVIDELRELRARGELMPEGAPL